MKIRYIISVGGAQPRQADEKIKGKYVWYDVPEYEAVRLIDADIAIAENNADYEKGKANYSALEAQKKAAQEVKETLKNLDGLKADLESKKESYKLLGAEMKDIDAKIKAAEATITPKAEA